MELAALNWVRYNIASFGGDPSRVTLFGSSAGSFDTVALMASPLSEGLIARAAVQGEFRQFLTGQFNTIDDAEQIGLEVSQAVACQSSADVLACLRATSASTLVLTADFLDLGPWVGGTVLPESPLQLVGERAIVPLIVGFDREEDAAFQPNSFDSPYPNDKWVKDTNAFVGPDLGVRARSLYPPSSYDSLLWSYITMLTDGKRGCPTRQLGNAVATRARVWRYLYTHTYEDDPFFAQFRASHILEEPLLWHSDVFGFGHLLTPTEETLSQAMTDYWTNFAKTANPNGPGLPNWPQYNSVSEPTLTLDDSIGVIANYHDPQCAFLDTVPVLFPFPWEVGSGKGPPVFPPGFLYEHARAIP